MILSIFIDMSYGGAVFAGVIAFCFYNGLIDAVSIAITEVKDSKVSPHRNTYDYIWMLPQYRGELHIPLACPGVLFYEFDIVKRGSVFSAECDKYG